MKARDGFTLVELVVAMTILTIGLVGLAGAATVAHQSFMGAEAVERGVDAAAFVLDSLMREPAPAAGERRSDNVVARWSVTADSIATAISLTIHVDDRGRHSQLTFHATHHAN